MAHTTITATAAARADDVVGPGQGRWTAAAFARLPKDETRNGLRFELIDGVLFRAAIGDTTHRLAHSALFVALFNHVQGAYLGRVYNAGVPVQLAPDTVVHPDVSVVLEGGRARFEEGWLIGPPDLVVEVLSPGGEEYDRATKLAAYAEAGVAEVWLSDPATREIEALRLTEASYLSVGIFRHDDTLPAGVLPALSVVVEQLFT